MSSAWSPARVPAVEQTAAVERRRRRRGGPKGWPAEEGGPPIAAAAGPAEPPSRAAAQQTRRSNTRRRATRNRFSGPTTPWVSSNVSAGLHSCCSSRSSSAGSVPSTDESAIYRPRAFANKQACTPPSSLGSTQCGFPRTLTLSSHSLGPVVTRSNSRSSGHSTRSSSRDSIRSDASSVPSTDESVIFRPRSMVDRRAAPGCATPGWRGPHEREEHSAPPAAAFEGAAPDEEHSAPPDAAFEDAAPDEEGGTPEKMVGEQRGGGGRALSEAPPGGGTTLLLQCLPRECTRDALVALLAARGFEVVFAYMPCHLATGTPFGYAFVDLATEAEAAKCWRCMSGFSGWGSHTGPACKIAWADTQGLQANIERYRNSSLMHSRVDDSMRPILLKDGVRVPFPRPTQKVKAPRTDRIKSSLLPA